MGWLVHVFFIQEVAKEHQKDKRKLSAYFNDKKQELKQRLKSTKEKKKEKEKQKEKEKERTKEKDKTKDHVSEKEDKEWVAKQEQQREIQKEVERLLLEREKQQEQKRETEERDKGKEGEREEERKRDESKHEGPLVGKDGKVCDEEAVDFDTVCSCTGLALPILREMFKFRGTGSFGTHLAIAQDVRKLPRFAFWKMHIGSCLKKYKLQCTALPPMPSHFSP